MTPLIRAWHRIRTLFSPSRGERDMRNEFESHIAMQESDNIRMGMDPASARREARIKFGSLRATEEAWRDQRGWYWIEETLRDLRLALAGLARNPAFGAVVILTLGVTIGLNLTVFSVVEAVLIEPLPFSEPDRLVTIYNSFPATGGDRLANSVPDYFLRRERVDGLENSALYVGSGENVTEADRTERVPGLRVTPSFFPTLGVEAALGRTFLEEEMDARSRSVILTHGYWRDRFGASEDVLGQTMEIDNVPRTIVGVLPESFQLPTLPEARLVHPLAFPPEQRSMEQWGGNNDFFMVGRLAEGTTPEQLESELSSLYRSVAYELLGEEGVGMLEQAGYRAVVVPAQEDLVRNVRQPVYLVWGAVTFVLLIGCVNIANLMLARSEVRLPEMATRAALGAGRLRLARQILAESAVVGLAGGVLGAFLGSTALRLLGVVTLSPSTSTDGSTAGAMALDLVTFGGTMSVERSAEVGLSASVLAYSLGLAIVTSILFGVIPIVNLFRKDLNRGLTIEGRGRTRSRRSLSIRSGLVAGQVALAFLLLVGAGLTLRSFQHIVDVDPGFEPEGVFTGYTALTGARYPDGPSRQAFYDRWLDAIRAIPGVETASVTSVLPFSATDRTTSIAPVGYQPRAGEAQVVPNWSVVGTDYFATLGIDLVEGREFEERDGPEQQRVIVIDERLANRFWGSSSALGQRMQMGGQEWTVIGVVESVEQKDLTAAPDDHVGAFYIPYRQFPIDDMAFVVRAEGAQTLDRDLRIALGAVDPDVPLFDLQPLTARVGGSLGALRTPMVLLGGFAAIAIFLAAVGTYGVLAYAVAQRRRETAIRMALGSRPGDILLMVLKQGLVLGGLGLVGGAIGAVLLARLLQSMLFGVAPLDPGVLTATTVVLGIAVIMASIVPARNATRVDPMRALAEE